MRLGVLAGDGRHRVKEVLGRAPVAAMRHIQRCPLRRRRPRAVARRGRYGRAGLSIRDRETVRFGSLLALRALQAFATAHSAGVPAILENPAPRLSREGAVSHPSLFELDEARALRRLAGVQLSIGDQCTIGGDAKKSTGWLHNLRAEAARPFERCCDHPR